jgi:hypothetical protein
MILRKPPPVRLGSHGIKTSTFAIASIVKIQWGTNRRSIVWVIARAF